MNFFTLGADCGQFQCDIFLTWHCAQTHFKYFIIDLFNSIIVINPICIRVNQKFESVAAKVQEPEKFEVLKENNLADA